MTLQRLLFISGLMALLLRPPAADAQVRLPSLFGDHMVLQARIPISIWGWAAPGEKVEVRFKARTYTAVAGKDRKWSLKLRACRAGGPYEMVVQGTGDRLVLSDVLVGDVWLASGQSNMEFGIQTDSRAAESIPEAKDSLIRFFYVPMAKSLETQSDIGHPVSDSDGKWVVCSPTLLASKWAWHGFSAVSYYFAQRMRAVTRGPIGVIGSYKGSTPAQAWMSLSALEMDTSFHHHVLARRKVMAIVDSASRASGAPHPVDVGFSTPANVFNAMIAPLIPYGIKGVIWYQGESNGDRLADALEYKALFPALIKDWRGKWGEGDFPFLYVQLPNFRAPARTPSEGNWPWVREAQLGALSLHRTGAAIRLFFQHTGGDLAAGHWDTAGATPHTVIDTATELKGFAIAGADMQFVWARAVLDGNTVVVSSGQVPRPVAVRYDWADNPTGNLYNREGLPASPFRTDR